MKFFRKIFHPEEEDLIDRDEFDQHLKDEEKKREQLGNRLEALEVEIDVMSKGEYSRRIRGKAS